MFFYPVCMDYCAVERTAVARLLEVELTFPPYVPNKRERLLAFGWPLPFFFKSQYLFKLPTSFLVISDSVLSEFLAGPTSYI